MRRRIGWVVASCLVIVALAAALDARAAAACVWDYDTLDAERQRTPDAFEAAVGFIPRHSMAYDEWRVADRQAKIDALPEDGSAEQRLLLHDDIAISLDRLGERDRAIEILRESLAIAPDRYETHANLGTVFAHAGQITNGLTHLRRAVEINPDAHFGREIVQIAVIEWAQTGMKADGTWEPPLSAESRLAVTRLPLEQDAAFIRAGLIGMLRFGRGDSPILLTALAETLRNQWQQRIAATAFLRAAEGAEARGWQKAAQTLTELAQYEIGIQHNLTWRTFVADYEQNRAQARTMHRLIDLDEQNWIENNVPVDERYAATWLAKELPIRFEPVDSAPSGFFADIDRLVQGNPAWLIACGAIVLVTLYYFWRRWRDIRGGRPRTQHRSSALFRPKRGRGRAPAPGADATSTSLYTASAMSGTGPPPDAQR